MTKHCHSCGETLVEDLHAVADHTIVMGRRYCRQCETDILADHLLCKRHQRRIEPPEGEGRWE